MKTYNIKFEVFKFGCSILFGGIGRKFDTFKFTLKNIHCYSSVHVGRPKWFHTVKKKKKNSRVGSILWEKVKLIIFLEKVIV